MTKPNIVPTMKDFFIGEPPKLLPSHTWSFAVFLPKSWLFDHNEIRRLDAKETLNTHDTFLTFSIDENVTWAIHTLIWLL